MNVAKVILEAVEDANREASDVQATPRGLLRTLRRRLLSVQCHLGAIVSRYLELFPEVSLDVVLEDKYADLLENRIDVAIRVGRLDDPSLVTRRLAPRKMVLCASPEYLKNTACQRRRKIFHARRVWRSAGGFSGRLDNLRPEGSLHRIQCMPNHVNNIQLLLESAGLEQA